MKPKLQSWPQAPSFFVEITPSKRVVTVFEHRLSERDGSNVVISVAVLKWELNSQKMK